jgi:chitodextrinase
MSIVDRARALRQTIESLATSMDDDTARDNAELFPRWVSGHAYQVGDRVCHDGVLYKILQEHTSQEDWTPDVAVSLFAEILPGQDGTEIGEWRQPDSTNPYMMGDRVTYNGKTYESTIDNNVWSPDVYGWQEVE